MACVPELVRLAGSLICAGFPGSDVDDAVLAEIEALGPGGLLLFARNVSDVERTRTLVSAVVAAAGGEIPALVCVDQEGGRVARLRFGGELPSQLTLGAANEVVLAERAGARLADELRAVGATVDFAPVLDLALAPQGTVVGTRSLGDFPARVARRGAAVVGGRQTAGVAATVKHFP
ncbi:MAG: glycoside hydrolase family 3 protein, partial [Candidatus Eremiobacteraeota bacterium]|nr:glycoside hydrolase family 3 protein [Candidatus Eremiobacteraeota bacterium]